MHTVPINQSNILIQNAHRIVDDNELVLVEDIPFEKTSWTLGWQIGSLFSTLTLHRVTTLLKILEKFLIFIWKVPGLETYLNLVKKPGIITKILEKSAVS